ncbi:peptidylprolyl isomerase [Qipengyuania profunda]|uniref:peptidylprolyl isomerase n=2 Tax=Erythrobacteraceae TaxID=335929 RepID=UPI002ED65916
MIRRAAILGLMTAWGVLLPSVVESRDCEHGDPAVELQTDAGVITILIHSKEAPASSDAFLGQVNAQQYDGGSFFRAVRPDNDRTENPIEVVQAAVGEHAPPLDQDPIPHEGTNQTGLKHIDGAVSLPRGDIGTTTATSFFVSIGPQPALDHGGKRNPDGQGFAVFGQVICGMDVVREIHKQPVSSDSPLAAMAEQILEQPVRILRARVVQPNCSGA